MGCVRCNGTSFRIGSFGKCVVDDTARFIEGHYIAIVPLQYIAHAKAIWTLFCEEKPMGDFSTPVTPATPNIL